MKKLMLLACGLLIALTQAKISAQSSCEEDNRRYTDTLNIKLQDGNKIMITGARFSELVEYTRADSLKTLFLNDYERALADKTIPENSPCIYYFVHDSGKRRLKAELPEYADSKVDITYEINRLKLDLPKYQYHIYDLTSGYTIHIYLNDPASLQLAIGSISINDAITEIVKDKASFKKNFMLEITREPGSYKLTGHNKHKFDLLWSGVSFGAGIFGNTLVPVADLSLMVQLNNKYGIGEHKFGFGISGSPLVSMSNGEIQQINYVNIYKLKYLKSPYLNSPRKESWFGVELGLVHSTVGSYNGSFEFGAVFEPKGTISYSVGFILDKKDHTVPYLTVMLPF